ncbi:MAG TPA: ribonuclease Z [Gemmatimonadaceae bacterium]|nr:ribonuclease Z [Gemmatimonadaceae bacterium]
MRLTTVGTGTAAPSPTRVNAGHLVETHGVRILFDCGSGVAHRMAALAVDWPTITHVAITHFHADHVSDLPTLFFAWRWGTLPPRSAPLELLGPPGTDALLARLEDALGPVRDLGFHVGVRELTPGTAAELADGVHLEARPVPHTAESIAYSLHDGERRIVYTGDTGYDPALGDWARGTDVLLAECSLPESMAIPTHLTPLQCARLAAIADPGHLVLTHFYPPVEREDVPAVIAREFGGPVTLAHDGWTTDF